MKSPNFDGWFRSRQKEMTQKLEALHLEALCNEVRKMCAYDYTYHLVIKIHSPTSQFYSCFYRLNVKLLTVL